MCAYTENDLLSFTKNAVDNLMEPNSKEKTDSVHATQLLFVAFQKGIIKTTAKCDRRSEIFKNRCLC